MTSKKLGLLAVVFAAAVIWAIPAASVGKPAALQKAGSALRDATADLGNAVDNTVTKTGEAVRKTRDKTKAALNNGKGADKRATTAEPTTQPPLHGSDPHAQGGVAVVDLNPSNERPLGAKPDGSDSGEDAIVGRARGEQVNGAYHGHITILTLLGQEIAGVDSAPGETKNGPLQPIQAGILDPLCASTNQQVCLAVLTANSTTTATRSDNDFAVARASVLGLGVGAAESHGVINQDAKCQAAVGSSRVANVSAPGGGAVAQVSDATTTSKSCNDGTPVAVTNTSHVIGLGGVQVPIPAAGCADGTPDTLTGIPAVLPIVCNAEDIAGAAAVREALDVFVLTVGSTSLTKATTASSEAISAAPPAEASGPQCSDMIDNDGDGVIDSADPGCHSDNDATNPASYNPNDDNETDKSGPTTPSSNADKQCADGKDNDGDGKIDAKDPGCHTDNNINNPYNPSDDSEGSDDNGNGNGGNGGNGGNAPTGGQAANNDTLPFTGTDVIGLGLAGLLMLAGGLLLRRREDGHPAL
jgi:LPXTG-motif cell wall-anchored protein